MRVRSGKIWGEFEPLTAASLNQMLDEASADQLVTADLIAGYQLLDVSTSQPSPTLGKPWIDETGQLRFGNGTYFQHGSGVIRLTNKSGASVSRGTVVRIDHGNQDSFLPTGVTSGQLSADGRVFGVVLDATIADNAAGFILYRGFAYVDIGAVSVSGGFGSATLQGCYVYSSGTLLPGKAIVIAPAVAQAEPFSLFGVSLETFTSATFVAGLHLCKVIK